MLLARCKKIIRPEELKVNSFEQVREVLMKNQIVKDWKGIPKIINENAIKISKIKYKDK